MLIYFWPHSICYSSIALSSQWILGESLIIWIVGVVNEHVHDITCNTCMSIVVDCSSCTIGDWQCSLYLLIFGMVVITQQNITVSYHNFLQVILLNIYIVWLVPSLTNFTLTVQYLIYDKHTVMLFAVSILCSCIML